MQAVRVVIFSIYPSQPPAAASEAATVVRVGGNERRSLMAGRDCLNSYAAVVQKFIFFQKAKKHKIDTIRAIYVPASTTLADS